MSRDAYYRLKKASDNQHRYVNISIAWLADLLDHSFLPQDQKEDMIDEAIAQIEIQKQQESVEQ